MRSMGPGSVRMMRISPGGGELARVVVGLNDFYFSLVAWVEGRFDRPVYAVGRISYSALSRAWVAQKSGWGEPSIWAKRMARCVCQPEAKPMRDGRSSPRQRWVRIMSNLLSCGISSKVTSEFSPNV